MKKFMPALAIIKSQAIKSETAIETIAHSILNEFPDAYSQPIEELWANTATAKCDVCKFGSWTVRETLGNKYI
jgi:hypothetical protein